MCDSMNYYTRSYYEINIVSASPRTRPRLGGPGPLRTRALCPPLKVALAFVALAAGSLLGTHPRWRG